MRDEVEWDWVSGIPAEELAQKHAAMQADGWRALDIAGWRGETDQYCVVWEKGNGPEGTIEPGLDDRTNRERFEQRKNEGLTPRTQHFFYDGDRLRISTLWARPEPANVRWGCWYGTRTTYESKWDQYQSQSDVSLAAHPR